MKLFSSLLLTCALATSAHADTIDVDKFLGWFDTLADTAVADQNDCGKLATDMNKSIDDNKAMIDAAQKAHAAGQTLTQAQTQRLMAAGKKIAGAVIVKCKDDAGVHGAIARLPGPHRQ
jgi:hypothetical protein